MMETGGVPRDTAEVETHRRTTLPPDAVPLIMFPRRLRARSWAAVAAGGILGLALGRLHFLHVLTIPRVEGLFAMEPLAFHAFWLFAGAAAGVFAAAILILIFEHPRTLPRNDSLSD